MLGFLLCACSDPVTTEDSAVSAGEASCDDLTPKLTLGSFPDGTAEAWTAFQDEDPLCFRTGPSGNGSAWPELRITGRSGHGHVTARLVRDGELLYEIRYDEAMSRPSDDLCAFTTHFYLWLPVQIIESFDGASAVLGAIYEDNDDPTAGMLQDSATMVPAVCNPEDEI